MTVFIDSSIFIEYLKGNNRLFESLIVAGMRNPAIQYVYNGVVLNEYLFYYLSVRGGKAPLTLKRETVISTLLMGKEFEILLHDLKFLTDAETFPTTVPTIMARYNLLPSDAFIVSTCQHYDIRFLASLDADFSGPCSSENIVLINSEETLNKAIDQVFSL